MNDELRAHGVQSVIVAAADTHGALLGKRIPLDALGDAVRDGMALCGVIWVLDGSGTEIVKRPAGYDGYFPSPDDGFGDVIVRVDPDTVRTVPWRSGVAIALADHFAVSEERLPISPRTILRSLVDRITGHGFEPVMALELEFYLLRGDVAQARTAQDLEPIARGSRLFRVTPSPGGIVERMFDELDAYDIGVEACNPESGPGQYEINLRHGPALDAADRAALLRTAVKELAERDGVVATFMAKPHPDWPGSSCHLHLSLARASANAFADGNGMSATMRHAAAGILATMPDLTALYAPTINAYRRMRPYSYTGTTAAWGIDNRTAAVRAICGGARARLEVRQGGADANPYLVAAAVLAGALTGIEEELEPPAPVEGDAYAQGGVELPSSLDAALKALDRSDVARRCFGSAFVDHFVALKRADVLAAARSVTDWEIGRYLHA
jgi:glutamine synthetase